MKNSFHKWIYVYLILCLFFIVINSVDSSSNRVSILFNKEKIHEGIIRLNQSIENPKVQKILWIYTLPPSVSSENFHQKIKAHRNNNENEKQTIQKNSQELTQQQETLFNEINIENTKYFAKKDDYRVIQINQSNYQQYLSIINSQKIQKIINLLNNRDQTILFNQISQSKNYQSSSKSISKQLENQPQKERINRTKKSIIKRLIIYFAILENGGIFIDHKATLVEPLDKWVQKLPSFPFINPTFQNQRKNPYCLAFYNDSFSSMKKNLYPQLKMNAQNFNVLFPNIEDYFLACGKGNVFLQKLTSAYIDLLNQGKNWQGFKSFNKDQQLIGLTSPYSIYEHGHVISSHFVLQKQQQNLQANKGPDKLAITSLSLFTINSRLGPQKLLNQFSIEDYKTFIYLMKLSLLELQLFIGPLRFIFVLNDKVVKQIVQQFSKYETETVFVQKNSFFHRFWLKHLKNYPQINERHKNVLQILSTYRVAGIQSFDNNSQDEIVQGLQRIQYPFIKRINFNQRLSKWESLNKKIWIIWDNGIEGNSNLIVELCYQNLKRSAQNSGFKIQAVSKDHIKNFISNQLLQKIQYAVKNAAFDLGSQAISDLWRLALIYEHGGIYFDASTFMIDQSFDWITKVPQFPQNLIWNRYGNEPSVFMFWNTYYCNPVDWKWDKANKVKNQWQLSLESNFIAAVKGSQLIKQWFDVMIQWVSSPFDKIQQQMKNVGMYQNRWTSDSFWHQARYLTVMDAIKYVLGRREKLIQSQKNQKNEQLYENAGQFYKLWSIPGQFIGQQKLRGETNYQNRDYRLEKQSRQIDNIYKYQYSMKQIEKVLGPIDFQGKFFNWELIMMNKMLIDFYLQNKQDFFLGKFDEILHPNSVIAAKLINRYPQKALELLRYYSELSQVKLKVKGCTQIWSY